MGRLKEGMVSVGLALLLAAVAAGCYVKVDKSKNGRDNDVSIHTPMGGLHVQQGTPSAEELGLPTYPGAVAVTDKGDDSSADVDVGFGSWQMHVRVAKYQTADSGQRVASFYRSALARFGDVLECRGGHAQGPQKTTREGLGCEVTGSDAKTFHFDDSAAGFDLRSGSKRHQRVVAITPGSDGTTRLTLLTLVRVDLPPSLEREDNQE